MLGSTILNLHGVDHTLFGDAGNLEDYSSFNADVIVHCAATVGGWKKNKEHPLDIAERNVKLNASVIRAAVNSERVRHIIAFGSGCMFDPLHQATEADMLKGEPYHNNLPYAYAKRMLLVQLEAAKKQYGMEYSFIVPPSMYGPNDNFSLDYGHVIASLIHKAYLAEQKGESLQVWGDGSPVREVAYASDVARYVLSILDKPQGRKVLSSGIQLSVAKMARAIAKIFGISCDYDLKQPNGEAHRSETRIITEWDWTPFPDGIAKTVEWFQNNYPNVRR